MTYRGLAPSYRGLAPGYRDLTDEWEEADRAARSLTGGQARLNPADPEAEAKFKLFTLESTAAASGVPTMSALPVGAPPAARIAELQERIANYEAARPRQAVARANVMDLLMGPAATTFGKLAALAKGTAGSGNPLVDLAAKGVPESFSQALAEERGLPPESGRIFK